MMLNIRNMESDRCKMFVKNELNKLGISYKTVELGEVKLKENISKEKLQLMDIALRNAGLELMGDKRGQLVEKIKTAIYQLIYFSDELQKPNISSFISQKLNYDYSYLSKLFTGAQGITIEKYIIVKRIDRVKKLLVNTKLNLVDIAFTLQYSSVAHLSAQFKKITGLTPSGFKELLNKSLHKTINV
jgi:AraC-like DNA-binding protein